MQAVTLRGTTARYKGNGRKLGYPTANMTIESGLEDGVYFGYANLGEYSNQPALIFIGIPTTVGDKDRRLEAHLLDIEDKDYYQQTLDVTIQEFHRSNTTFESLDELVKVMQADEAAARAWFKSQELS